MSQLSVTPTRKDMQMVAASSSQVSTPLSNASDSLVSNVQHSASQSTDGKAFKRSQSSNETPKSKKKKVEAKEDPMATRITNNKAKIQMKFIGVHSISITSLLPGPFQRPMSLKHVDEMYELHQRFLHLFSDTIVTVYCVGEESSGQYYVLDGQHRLAAIKKWNELHNKTPAQQMVTVKCHVYKALTQVEVLLLMNLIDEKNGACLHFCDIDIVQQLRSLRMSGDPALVNLKPNNRSVSTHNKNLQAFHKGVKEQHLFVSAAVHDHYNVLLKLFANGQRFNTRQWRSIYRAYNYGDKAAAKVVNIVNDASNSNSSSEVLIKEIEKLFSPLMIAFYNLNFEHDFLDASSAITALFENTLFANVDHDEKTLAKLLETENLDKLRKPAIGALTLENFKAKLTGELTSFSNPKIEDSASVSITELELFEVVYINLDYHLSLFGALHSQSMASNNCVLICRHKVRDHSSFNNVASPYKCLLIPDLKLRFSDNDLREDYLSIWIFGPTFNSDSFLGNWKNLKWIKDIEILALIKQFSERILAFVSEPEAEDFVRNFNEKSVLYCPDKISMARVMAVAQQVAIRDVVSKAQTSKENNDEDLFI